MVFKSKLCKICEKIHKTKAEHNKCRNQEARLKKEEKRASQFFQSQSLQMRVVNQSQNNNSEINNSEINNSEINNGSYYNQSSENVSWQLNRSQRAREIEQIFQDGRSQQQQALTKRRFALKKHIGHDKFREIVELALGRRDVDHDKIVMRHKLLYCQQFKGIELPQQFFSKQQVMRRRALIQKIPPPLIRNDHDNNDEKLIKIEDSSQEEPQEEPQEKAEEKPTSKLSSADIERIKLQQQQIGVRNQIQVPDNLDFQPFFQPQFFKFYEMESKSIQEIKIGYDHGEIQRYSWQKEKKHLFQVIFEKQLLSAYDQLCSIPASIQKSRYYEEIDSKQFLFTFQPVMDQQWKKNYQKSFPKGRNPDIKLIKQIYMKMQIKQKLFSNEKFLGKMFHESLVRYKPMFKKLKLTKEQDMAYAILTQKMFILQRDLVLYLRISMKSKSQAKVPRIQQKINQDKWVSDLVMPTQKQVDQKKNFNHKHLVIRIAKSLKKIDVEIKLTQKPDKKQRLKLKKQQKMMMMVEQNKKDNQRSLSWTNQIIEKLIKDSKPIFVSRFASRISNIQSEYEYKRNKMDQDQWNGTYYQKIKRQRTKDLQLVQKLKLTFLNEDNFPQGRSIEQAQLIVVKLNKLIGCLSDQRLKQVSKSQKIFLQMGQVIRFSKEHHFPGIIDRRQLGLLAKRFQPKYHSRVTQLQMKNLQKIHKLVRTQVYFQQNCEEKLIYKHINQLQQDKRQESQKKLSAIIFLDKLYQKKCGLWEFDALWMYQSEIFERVKPQFYRIYTEMDDEAYRKVTNPLLVQTPLGLMTTFEYNLWIQFQQLTQNLMMSFLTINQNLRSKFCQWLIYRHQSHNRQHQFYLRAQKIFQSKYPKRTQLGQQTYQLMRVHAVRQVKKSTKQLLLQDVVDTDTLEMKQLFSLQYSFVKFGKKGHAYIKLKDYKVKAVKRLSHQIGVRRYEIYKILNKSKVQQAGSNLLELKTEIEYFGRLGLFSSSQFDDTSFQLQNLQNIDQLKSLLKKIMQNSRKMKNFRDLLIQLSFYEYNLTHAQQQHRQFKNYQNYTKTFQVQAPIPQFYQQQWKIHAKGQYELWMDKKIGNQTRKEVRVLIELDAEKQVDAKTQLQRESDNFMHELAKWVVQQQQIGQKEEQQHPSQKKIKENVVVLQLNEKSQHELQLQSAKYNQELTKKQLKFLVNQYERQIGLPVRFNTENVKPYNWKMEQHTQIQSNLLKESPNFSNHEYEVFIGQVFKFLRYKGLTMKNFTWKNVFAKGYRFDPKVPGNANLATIGQPNQHDRDIIDRIVIGKAIMPIKFIHRPAFGGGYNAIRKILKNQPIAPFSGYVDKLINNSKNGDTYNRMDFSYAQNEKDDYSVGTSFDIWSIGPMINTTNCKRKANIKLLHFMTERGIQVWMVAIRDIAEGQHLVWFYGASYSHDNLKIIDIQKFIDQQKEIQARNTSAMDVEIPQFQVQVSQVAEKPQIEKLEMIQEQIFEEQEIPSEKQKEELKELEIPSEKQKEELKEQEKPPKQQKDQPQKRIYKRGIIVEQSQSETKHMQQWKNKYKKLAALGWFVVNPIRQIDNLQQFEAQIDLRFRWYFTDKVWHYARNEIKLPQGQIQLLVESMWYRYHLKSAALGYYDYQKYRMAEMVPSFARLNPYLHSKFDIWLLKCKGVQQKNDKIIQRYDGKQIDFNKKVIVMINNILSHYNNGKWIPLLFQIEYHQRRFHTLLMINKINQFTVAKIYDNQPTRQLWKTDDATQFFCGISSFAKTVRRITDGLTTLNCLCWLDEIFSNGCKQTLF